MQQKTTKKEVVAAFRTREILAAAREVMERQGGENIRRDLAGIVESSLSPVEKLLKVISMLMDNLERERLLFPVYMRDLVQWSQKGGQAQFPRVRTLEEEIVGILTRLFSEGIARGVFMDADPKLLTFLLRGLVRAVGYYQMTSRQEDAVKEA